MSADNAIFVRKINGKFYTRHQQMPFIDDVEWFARHPGESNPWTWNDVDTEMTEHGKQFDTRDEAILSAADEVRGMVICEYGVIEI